MSNPLLPAVKKIADKYEKFGNVSDQHFNSFNNQRVVRAALRKLGYVPDDDFQPSIWYSRDHDRYKNMTVIDRVRSQLIEGRLVTVSTARTSSTTLKVTIYTLRVKEGFEIDTVRSGRGIEQAGYRLRHKFNSLVAS